MTTAHRRSGEALPRNVPNYAKMFQAAASPPTPELAATFARIGGKFEHWLAHGLVFGIWSVAAIGRG